MRNVLYRWLWGGVRLAGEGRIGNGFLYLAAGLRTRAELEADARRQAQAFAVSPQEVDEGLSPDERHFYSTLLRDGERVLVVGCGTGREVLALASAGYQVAGLDLTPEVIEMARANLKRRALAAELCVGPIQTASLDGLYDAVVFSNGCYSFIQGAAVRAATLAKIARHLTPGGRVIFSYYPFQGQSPVGRWLTAASARLSGADWEPERGDIFTRDTVVPGTVRYRHAFDPDGFSREAAAGGLRAVSDQPAAEVFRFAAAIRDDGDGGVMDIPETEDQWCTALTPEQFDVLRKHGTERPGSSPLNKEHREGLFSCAGCGQPLFQSNAKFDSGTGWPSFWAPIENAVSTTVDRKYGMVRTEVHCSKCQGHLGHVFEDGPRPTGLRYCMNGVALRFDPKAGEKEEMS